MAGLLSLLIERHKFLPARCSDACIFKGVYFPKNRTATLSQTIDYGPGTQSQIGV